MAFACKIPVIVGVGDVKNRSRRVEDAIEPVQLMSQAVLSAIEDTGLPKSTKEELQSSIDSVSVVATWSWPYHDLPGLLSQKLDIQPRHKTYSEHGGNQPIKLVDEVARKISQGETKVAIVTGGEALASRKCALGQQKFGWAKGLISKMIDMSACSAAKILPPPGWTTLDTGIQNASPLKLPLPAEGIGAAHAIGLPVHVYALYENGFRAHRGQSIPENNNESAQLYADFAKVAERNEYSWTYGQAALTEGAISTVSKRNRMICFPYPLLMNAFNNINLAGSCILTSTEYAKELGISESKWVYPLGGAGTQDSDDFWERPNYHSSPSISRSLDACLEVSGLAKEQISLFDFYSCFPIVPKLACQHLGLPFTKSPKPITLLGGLTSFGGAGNNYSMHALTAMVRGLRSGNGQNGLILANGGILTYQHALCLGTQPRRNESAYPDTNPLPRYVTDLPIPRVSAQAEGEAIIETYTVEFNRNGTPSKGFVVGRLTNDNHRFVANTGDAITLEQLSSRHIESIGRVGWVKRGEMGRNLFVFDRSARL